MDKAFFVMDKTLFVAGLDYSISSYQLKKIFSMCGIVESATVVVDRVSRKSRGFGFVNMDSPESAEECINKLNNTFQCGRQIIVKKKEERIVEENEQVSEHFN